VAISVFNYSGISSEILIRAEEVSSHAIRIDGLDIFGRVLGHWDDCVPSIPGFTSGWCASN
jgi:hypothetical protein